MPKKKIEKRDYSAQNKWKKENVTTVVVNLYKSNEDDKALLESLEKAGASKAQWAKDLMRKGLLYEVDH